MFTSVYKEDEAGINVLGDVESVRLHGDEANVHRAGVAPIPVSHHQPDLTSISLHHLLGPQYEAAPPLWGSGRLFFLPFLSSFHSSPLVCHHGHQSPGGEQQQCKDRRCRPISHGTYHLKCLSLLPFLLCSLSP